MGRWTLLVLAALAVVGEVLAASPSPAAPAAPAAAALKAPQEAEPAASEPRAAVLDSQGGEVELEDEPVAAEYREFQQFRFPDDPRFDPRLHQLSPQQQSQILEDIRQHHRFHQQHQQQQQLHQQHLRQRPLRNRQPTAGPLPSRPETHFTFNQPHRQPAVRPDPYFNQEQSQFNAISPINHRQQPYRLQGDGSDAYKIQLTNDKPIVNFHSQVSPAQPVQPLLFVQQPTLNIVPQLDDGLLSLQQPQFTSGGPEPGRQHLYNQPPAPQPESVQQPHHHQHPQQPQPQQPQQQQQPQQSQQSQQPQQPLPPVTTRPTLHKNPFETNFQKPLNQHYHVNSAEYTPKENTIATASQNYFTQTYNKQSNKIPVAQDPALSSHEATPDYFEPAVTPFPPSRTQPPRSEVIHDLPIPVTRIPIVTEAPKINSTPKSQGQQKPLYFGDRKLPKPNVSVSPLAGLPKIKFPKELEEEYSLVSVKHLNEAVSEAEHSKSTERPRNPKIRLENHLLQYGQSEVETTTTDYTPIVHLQEDRKHLLDHITKSHQLEQATKPPRPRKTTKPSKEIIEITYQQKASTPKPSATKTTKSKTEEIVHPPDLQEQLLKQLQEQFSQRKDLIQQLKVDPSAAAVVPSNILTSSDFLPKNATGPIITSNGQRYQVIQLPAKEAQALLAKQKAATTKLTPATSTTTPKPPKKVLDELTQGVIPQGADFEIIRKTEDGRLEPVRGVPSSLPDKKVTFVLLEEQQDGSYKVQGVRGNEANKESGGEEVDSILKKIKAGEIELPPPSRDNSVAKRTTLAPARASSSLDSVASPSSPTSGPTTTTPVPPTTPHYFEPTSKTQNIKVYVNSGSGDLRQTSPNNIFSTVTPDDYPFSSSTARPSYSSIPTSPSPSTVYNTYSPSTANDSSPASRYETPSFPTYNTDSSPSPGSYYTEPTTNPETTWQVSASSSSFSSPGLGSTLGSSPNSIVVSSSAIPSPTPSPGSTGHNFYSQTQFLPTVSPNIPDNSIPSSTADPAPYSIEPQLNQKGYYSQPSDAPVSHFSDSTSAYYPTDRTPDDTSDKNHRSIYNPTLNNPGNHKYSNLTADPIRVPDTLIDTLKKHGLYAMARFLRQSGLDSILNDTGPYTVFVPTDRAFKTLLVQLGGPDRAEEKFRENPRLLSGLLLHHVIPGAFRLTSLQDEMTGVSLAGTQLRVNTYTTQDVEWNDVQVVTINGAQVSQELSDISIPQGIAHAVDRVMFPLPVGDLVQTMTADKDRRFATFLRAVRASGLQDMLTGSKTYTVFAPTERAFQGLKDSELARLTSERAGARALVLKHIMPTTFYSAGMRYFQVRESMARGKQITIVNEEGRIKANAALIVTHNIPATNGVVHAIDTLL